MKMSARFDRRNVAKVNVRVSASLWPRRSEATYTTRSTVNTDILQRAHAEHAPVEQGACGSRGGLRMTSTSSGWVSKTIEHAGSMIRCRNAMWMGISTSGERIAIGTRVSPMIGRCTARMYVSAFEALDDASADAHGVDERREVVLEQHDGCGFPGHVRATRAHRDADARPERGGVVHAVPRHGHHLATPGQGSDQTRNFCSGSMRAKMLT